ncbi:cytochrome P450 [Delitschia confertaspora ATCC 74209]|uniref:Cytochrome P450 n=1 Tax=Delitschia confertaspora ATCC 74209 TaxID=1513339 RepID=A0A9P4JFT0_9PLEO|nr:cytochrome P450 [Delitschia confertaspora ATCC 74209]
MANEVTQRRNILMRPFDNEFLLHQRLEASVLSPRASACYTPLQEMESRVLLQNLLRTNDFIHEFERYAASIVYSLAYGFRIVTGDEWQVQVAHQALQNISSVTQVGQWAVDSLPFLNYLPKPLAPWKKTAEEFYALETNLHMTNMNEALVREDWNWTKDFKNAKEAEGLSDTAIAWDLGNLANAGVETTNVVMQVFVMACVSHPNFIATAQKELDEVVGSDRLPEVDDLDNLPYIAAIIEETFRWRHIVPVGIPHATTEDNYYKGYLIPRGSTIIPLFNTMRRDGKLFHAPLDFRPERWLNKKQSGNWGYGRRICPGRFIATNSLRFGIARMLWAFNIRLDGKPLLVDESAFTMDGIVSAPKPFKAIFEPRSEQHRRVVEQCICPADIDVSKILKQIHKQQVSVGLNPRV